MDFSAYLHHKVHGLTEHPTFSRIHGWVVLRRLWIIIALHLILFALSYLLSFFFLIMLFPTPEHRAVLWSSIVPLVLIRFFVFGYHDLYQGLWRYVSLPDLLNIIRSAAISSMIFAFAGMLWKPWRVPERLLILDLVFCIMLVGGVRFLVRNFREKFFPGQRVTKRNHVLLAGPLDRVQPVVKEMLTDPYGRYNPSAILDPTMGEKNSLLRISDIPVVSVKQMLARKSRLGNLHGVILCWPEASREELDHLVETLKPLQIPFKTLPGLDQILSGEIRIGEIRDVEIEDLLERPPVQIQMDRVRSYLQDKTVLVTGGGGSIGSELCRQIAEFKPASLVIVERSENTLYELLLELKDRFPHVPLHASISSINDGPGLSALIREMHVDVVFHAAAYKHVPLMEMAPVESAYNNILGTYNAGRASIQAGVRRFVMISTDKAVNPSNVMGATKRIAEMVVQGMENSSKTRFNIVRFGNVLGSAGSVIPILKKQILQGQPVTVTHPEIERFFMTIPEAVQLVLQAGCMGNGGEIFVLDMGRPVKILKLAEKLITLSGKRPYEDVEIKFTGLRPGEKMYEELFNLDEKRIETTHPQISVAVSAVVERGFIESEIKKIQEMVALRDEAGLIARFKEIVPNYQNHSSPPYPPLAVSSSPRVSSRQG